MQWIHSYFISHKNYNVHLKYYSIKNIFFVQNVLVFVQSLSFIFFNINLLENRHFSFSKVDIFLIPHFLKIKQSSLDIPIIHITNAFFNVKNVKHTFFHDVRILCMVSFLQSGKQIFFDFEMTFKYSWLAFKIYLRVFLLFQPLNIY